MQETKHVQETKILQETKCVGFQDLKPRKFKIIFLSWEQQFPFLISYELPPCELAICVILMFLSIDNILDSI
jgi:ABC-type nickel/cobalt efflux system permease component RcnA